MTVVVMMTAGMTRAVYTQRKVATSNMVISFAE